MGSSHPTIWRFLESLRRTERKEFVKLNQILSGSQPPSRKKIYRDYELKLQNVVKSYGTMPVVDYLLNVASNLKLAV